MYTKAVLLIVAALPLAACVPANVKELQDQNQLLTQKLGTAESTIMDLRAERKLLKNEIEELNRVADILDQEKDSRVKESANLRDQVRKYMERQMDSTKAFLLTENLMDYVGAELVQRNKLEQKPIFLVDLEHPLPRAGTLTGVAGYFSHATELRLKILRPVKDEYVVIWQSHPIRVAQPGVNRIELPVTVGVEKGDLMAYFFPKKGGAVFDEGTGNTRYRNEDVPLGKSVTPRSLLGAAQQRAYSLGVFALLK